jgi:hypothetical protein
MSNNLARTAGLMEPDVAPGSGLARRQVRLHLVSGQTANVNAQPIGGAASAAVTTWTALTINNAVNPFGTTLVAQIVQASNTTGTVRLRIRGYNQFHEYQEELTPTVAIVSKTNNFVYLAKCWSYITSVAFLSTGLDVAGDTISIGQRWDWTRTNDATNEHLAGRNLGFPLLLRSGRVPGRLFRGQGKVQQRIGPTLVGDQNTTDGTIQLPHLPLQFPERVSQGFLVPTGGANPSNGETVTIDGIVYTFLTVLTSAAGAVLIGPNATLTLHNLLYAINAAGSQAGVGYGSSTVAHPTVRADIIGLSGGVPYMQVLARSPGTYGFTITTTETGANLSWASGGQLGSGVDAPFEVQGLVVWDLTGQASAGAVTTVPHGHFSVGLSEVGWDGPIEKVHLLTAASVAQWATTDNIMVSYQMMSADGR